MADEHTQTPSRLRREQARVQGLAPHSPWLTASMALGVGVVMLTTGGGWLAGAFVTGLRRSARHAGELQSAAEPVAAVVREVSLSLFAWLVALGAVVVVACVAVHQLQAGGVWAPGRLAPFWGRLWRAGSAREDENDVAARLVEGLGRALGNAMRALVMASLGTAAFCAQGGLSPISNDVPLQRIFSLGSSRVLTTLGVVAVGAVVLGLVDYGLKRLRFERMLQTTPDEQRAEQQAIDGDPAVRSRRAQLARSWMRDPGELVAGTALVVTGKAGLTVLLAGSPPPGRVTVRTIARGIAASTLRHGAERAGVPLVPHPALAEWFASSRAVRRSIPPRLAAELLAHWPRPPRGATMEAA